MQLDFRINARPTRQELDDLCRSVGWSAFGDDYPSALNGYSVTASAWTDTGQLVGWTSVVSDNVRHAFLLDVMVHPEFQGRGIGRQIVKKAIVAMGEKGVTAFHVDCAPDQAAFYAKCGFNIGAGGWLDTATPSDGLVLRRPTEDEEAEFLRAHRATSPEYPTFLHYYSEGMPFRRYLEVLVEQE